MRAPEPGRRRSGAERLPISLIGLRCSGKTTVGRELALLLSRPFVDLDDEVAALAGAASAGELIEELGLATFRRLEARVLERLLTEGRRTGKEAGNQPPVLATGGGAIEDAVNRQWLAQHTRCVWLRAGLELLRARLGADPTGRPSLTGADPGAELELLDARRAALYAAVAELEVDAGRGTPRELAERIRAALATGEQGRA